MTDTLAEAVRRLEALPASEQDELARELLGRLVPSDDDLDNPDDRRWEQLLSRPTEGTELERIAERARRDDEAGLATSLEDWLAAEPPK